jgi:hypothetical protein
MNIETILLIMNMQKVNIMKLNLSINNIINNTYLRLLFSKNDQSTLKNITYARLVWN